MIASFFGRDCKSENWKLAESLIILTRAPSDSHTVGRSSSGSSSRFDLVLIVASDISSPFLVKNIMPESGSSPTPTVSPGFWKDGAGALPSSLAAIIALGFAAIEVEVDKKLLQKTEHHFPRGKSAGIELLGMILRVDPNFVPMHG